LRRAARLDSFRTNHHRKQDGDVARPNDRYCANETAGVDVFLPLRIAITNGASGRKAGFGWTAENGEIADVRRQDLRPPRPRASGWAPGRVGDHRRGAQGPLRRREGEGPEPLAIVRDIDGPAIVTLSAIARALEARGVQTPRGSTTWQTAQVARLQAMAA